MNKFNVEYTEREDLVVGCCPVHRGTLQSSFNLNIDEQSDYFGNWFCNSHKCHEKYGRDIIGLAFGLLSLNQQDIKFPAVLKFCEQITEGTIINCQFSQTDNVTKFFSYEKKKNKNLLSRDQVRNRLIIPAQYYLNRGYSPNILDEFDVGYCNRKDSLFYGRIVFPVYSEDGKWMIGATARHPDYTYNKWINSKGFCKSAYLYGYHRAIKRAKEIGALILVEGQGDVLRMHEAGICNTVGIFGSSLSDSQEFLLQKTGVMNIILAMDSDEAGEIAYQTIASRLKNLFNIYKFTVPTKDIGELKVSDLNSLKGQIKCFV